MAALGRSWQGALRHLHWKRACHDSNSVARGSDSKPSLESSQEHCTSHQFYFSLAWADLREGFYLEMWAEMGGNSLKSAIIRGIWVELSSPSRLIDIERKHASVHSTFFSLNMICFMTWILFLHPFSKMHHWRQFFAYISLRWNVLWYMKRRNREVAVWKCLWSFHSRAPDE
jgi:hypothetical protein